MYQSIDYDELNRYSESFKADRANLVAQNAVTSSGVQVSARRWSSRKNADHQYSIRIKNRGITSQKSSGRCWMFAALNCMRFQVIQNLNLDDFELSQNYTFFYDQLEKANFFLESIIDSAAEPLNSRVVSHLLRSPVQDGGQWDMIAAIVEKYGVVPKTMMPESFASSSTRDMVPMINEKLRGDARTLRLAYAAGKKQEELHALKKDMVAEVYRMLAICLGTPPTAFDFEARDKDGNFICDRGITPKEFYKKYVAMDLNEYISLINAPTADKPYMRSYTVKYLGNVAGGRQVKYVNLPIEQLKAAAIKQMKDGEPVWFGCDVGKRSTRTDGVMDLEAYDYESLFNIAFDMNKAERLDYGHSQMTHAMVFQGVDLDADNKPLRWCVENSWGPDSGEKGMYLMTDEWFDEYMYQVVVRRKYLDEAVLNAFDSEPVVLAPWDPMGSLA